MLFQSMDNFQNIEIPFCLMPKVVDERDLLVQRCEHTPTIFPHQDDRQHVRYEEGDDGDPERRKGKMMDFRQ